MMSHALFVYVAILPSQLATSLLLNSDSGVFFVLILLIILLSCMAAFVSLFTAERKKTHSGGSSRRDRTPPKNSEGNRTMRRGLMLFPTYFRRHRPGTDSLPHHPTPPPREQQTKPETLEQDSEAQENVAQNKHWLRLAEECVELFGELDELLPDLDPARRDMAQHVMSRLQEILTRSGVEVIEHDSLFDPSRHRLVSPGQVRDVDKSPITIISPGFAVGRLILHPARVHLADLLSPSDEQT